MKTQKLPIALPQSKDLFYERKWYFDTAFFTKLFFVFYTAICKRFHASVV